MKYGKSIFSRCDILIPRQDCLPLWPVIACDQYTSQPEYWQDLEKKIGDSPSALHLILPEARLGNDTGKRIALIHETMDRYLSEGLFETLYNAYVYVERTLSDGKIRKGLVGVIDLEAYDYLDRTDAPVRASEKTVISRIPPRMDSRRGASLESSHVLLLYHDPEDRIMNSVRSGRLLYDLTLMPHGGRIRGRVLDGEAADRVDSAVAEYVRTRNGAFPFAVGDGNHSLAAAKGCWEEIKSALTPDEAACHPARWAMVELENICDDAQCFEPIHRLVTQVDTTELISFLSSESSGSGELTEWVTAGEGGSLSCDLNELQALLDEYLARKGGCIDYIHGSETVKRLAEEKKGLALLPGGISKDSLFDLIARGGVLPRKTFSIGKAEDKRYYLECRKIIK